MFKLTLVNNFHNTETTIHVPQSGKLTPRQIRRARRALCGVKGCTCGGELGERGPQPQLWTLEHINGGVCIRRNAYEGKMNVREQEMRQEAREQIIECLKDEFEGHYCDLHNEVFNTEYYIIGTYEAKKALKEYDVFEAIEKVKTYEKSNFGEVYTDLTDPEKLINMLFYIIGEEVLFEMMDGIETWNENWNNVATDETNAKILEELGENG